MASISLNSNYLAVGSDTVSIKVTGGEDFTDGEYNNKYENIHYYSFSQTYYFENCYTNSTKTSRTYTVEDRNNNNGEIAIKLYGLSEGALNNIKVSINYSFSYRRWDKEEDGWGRLRTETGSKGTDNLYVYTRNKATSGQFWRYQHPTAGPIAIEKGEYITNHITTTNVDQWLVQLGIWSSWREQDNNYSSYNNYTGITTVTVPNLNGSGTITLRTPTSGNDITASWYRNCGNACGLSNMSSIKGLGDSGVAAENATYIKASHFINLAKAVIDWT